MTQPWLRQRLRLGVTLARRQASFGKWHCISAGPGQVLFTRAASSPLCSGALTPPRAGSRARQYFFGSVGLASAAVRAMTDRRRCSIHRSASDGIKLPGSPQGLSLTTEALLL